MRVEHSLWNHESPSIQSLWMKDLSFLLRAISIRDYESVIMSQELFWSAFCKVHSEVSRNSEYFSTTLRGNELGIRGTKHIIESIRKTVEEIRRFFEKGFTEKKSFTIVLVDLVGDYHLREDAAVIDVTNWLSRFTLKMGVNCFNDYIMACIDPLAELLGANCLFGVSDKKYKIRDASYPETCKCPTFKIEWSQEEYEVYPIPPVAIAKRQDTLSPFYSMYEKQVLCDTRLQGYNGEVCLHSAVLYAYGGEVFQKMLTNSFKEALEKTICMEYHINVLKLFIEYLYLGESIMTLKKITSENIDLGELLSFAHTYQHKLFADCCTNLISLASSAEDIEKIKALAKLYNNAHLKKLFEHFSSKKNFIKV